MLQLSQTFCISVSALRKKHWWEKRREGRSDVRQSGKENEGMREWRKEHKGKVDFFLTVRLVMWGVGVEWENFGPGSHLISLSYLAFPLVKLSISEAFGGSRLSLSFGENELSWKLHYLPCLMWAHFSHTAISSPKPFGDAQWSVSMFISKCLAFLQSIISRTVSVW